MNKLMMMRMIQLLGEKKTWCNRSALSEWLSALPLHASVVGMVPDSESQAPMA
jgi:hypothetical protein